MLIEPFLSREFMLQVSEATDQVVNYELARRDHGQRRRGSHEIDEIPSEDLRTLSEALRELPRTFAQPGAGDNADLARAGRPDGAMQPRDDFVFLPHDPLMCLVQSACDEAVHTYNPDRLRAAAASAPSSRRATAVDDPIGGYQLEGVGLHASGQRRAWKAMEVAKGKWVWLSDPRWAVCLLTEMYSKATKSRAGFVDRPATVEIDDDAVVILVGDWGSGLPRADAVAQQIRTELARYPRRQRIVVHLGDVYYSGTAREFRRRFLETWPVDPGSEVLSFAVPGNHEMYSGGHGYYSAALADDRFARQNGCSFFAMKNDHWQFLGLDTAYADAGLHGPQATWARQRIEAAGPDVKTCLLSHHQLFSSHETTSQKLRADIKPVLATGRVAAWFWGHEHRCIAYQDVVVDDDAVRFASCVGHGGIPEYLVMKEGQRKPKPWGYEYLAKHGNWLEPWNTFGFAVLELSGAVMKVRYVDENGFEHKVLDDSLSWSPS